MKNNLQEVADGHSLLAPLQKNLIGSHSDHPHGLILMYSVVGHPHGLILMYYVVGHPHGLILMYSVVGHLHGLIFMYSVVGHPHGLILTYSVVPPMSGIVFRCTDMCESIIYNYISTLYRANNICISRMTLHCKANPYMLHWT